MVTTARTRRVSDPLTAALQPPPDETVDAREARIANEREAKKVSDSIDEQIRQEKDARKAKLKGRKQIKVLLLGQSESGKSTTLKRKSPWVIVRVAVGSSRSRAEFQLAYTPNAFRDERLAWRPVIYLNLVRSVRRIVDALSTVDSPNTSTASDPTDDDDPPQIHQRPDASTESYARRQPIDQTSASTSALFSSPPYVELKARLEPIFALEERLIQQLAGGDDDEATQLAWPVPLVTSGTPKDPTAAPTKQEISISTRHNWKKALNKLALGTKAGA